VRMKSGMGRKRARLGGRSTALGGSASVASGLLNATQRTRVARRGLEQQSLDRDTSGAHAYPRAE
jgi:hypothetical protein